MWKPVILIVVAAIVSSFPGQAMALPAPAQAVASTAAAQEPASPPPLFASHRLLELTLAADFDKLKGDRKEDSEYRPGVLTVTADDGSPREIELKVRTRGKFRLKTCRFPPLRINLPKKSLGGTAFDGQNKIKLVTHCRDRDGDEQNVLEEYLVYRSYNIITDQSFRVRLARITYVDTSGDDDPVTRYAFFLEEVDAIAERVGGMILQIKQVHPRHLSGRESARMAVFQYMVGNTDWSMIYFHNVELLRTAESVHIPVPYDFDWAGFVSPSYAKPDVSLDLRTVRQRLYRGFCRADVDFPEIYSEFVDHRLEFEALYRETEGLEENKIEDALKYTKEFYDVISSESRARRRIEGACRRS